MAFKRILAIGCHKDDIVCQRYCITVFFFHKHKTLSPNICQHVCKLQRKGRTWWCVLHGKGGRETSRAIVKCKKWKRGCVKCVDIIISGNPSKHSLSILILPSTGEWSCWGFYSLRAPPHFSLLERVMLEQLLISFVPPDYHRVSWYKQMTCSLDGSLVLRSLSREEQQPLCPSWTILFWIGSCEGMG